jgi:hypothetical protein
MKRKLLLIVSSLLLTGGCTKNIHEVRTPTTPGPRLIAAT